VSDPRPTRPVRLELPIESDEEVSALRSALLAARATELTDLNRRAGRHALGYGSDTARDSMTAEAARLRLRHDMLDRLIAALDQATRRTT
jgi:hypothetical protein